MCWQNTYSLNSTDRTRPHWTVLAFRTRPRWTVLTVRTQPHWTVLAVRTLHWTVLAIGIRPRWKLFTIWVQPLMNSYSCLSTVLTDKVLTETLNMFSLNSVSCVSTCSMNTVSCVSRSSVNNACYNHWIMLVLTPLSCLKVSTWLENRFRSWPVTKPQSSPTTNRRVILLRGD